jgi:cold shock CspA family protein
MFSDDDEFSLHELSAVDDGEILNGRVLFFNEINGTGYIEQDSFAEKLRFSYKHIIKEGYRSLYEGQRIVYGVKKVGTGTKVTFIKSMDVE